MKKWFSLLLAAVMLLTLAGCSLNFLNRYDGSSQQDEENPPAAAEPEEPGISDTQPEPGQPEPPSGGPDALLPDPDKSEDGIAGVDEGGAAGGITASHADVTLKTAGETFTLSVQGLSGFYASTFASADPAIAEVDEMLGTVTAVAPGTTAVTMHVECEQGQFDFECIVRCNWTEEEEPSVPASGTASDLPSLSSFFSGLQGSYDGLNAMMVMDGELLENYYPGLSGIAAVEEVLIQETMVSISNIAVGLVKLSDDATIDDVIAVQNILQERIATQANGGAWYPESCETWGQGVITSAANVVGMFVYPGEAQAMADLFTQAYSN